MSGGRLYINGQIQDEPFTAEEANYEFGPVVVPAGDVLVLGDNRNHRYVKFGLLYHFKFSHE